MHSHSHSHGTESEGSCQHNHDPTASNPQYQQNKHKHEVKSAFANYAKDMRTGYDRIYSDNKLCQYFELVRARKRERMEIALEANQKFLNHILDANSDPGEQFVAEEVTMCNNISKIRTTVKQFFREWCSESPELADCHFLVELTKKYLPVKSRVLVPGCGLARLALQLVEAGYATQGNEVTYFMLFGSNFILNCVQAKEQFEIYPFVHTLNHHMDDDSMFRSVRVPDKLALDVVPQDADFSMAAGEFTEIYGRSVDNKFHGIVTCFFIDTANNILSYIDTIYDTLQPGGVWINYGPLLYHFKGMLNEVSIELSWEQVEAYIRHKGLRLLERQERNTTYCHDPRSAYSHNYRAGLTVWGKPGAE